MKLGHRTHWFALAMLALPLYSCGGGSSGGGAAFGVTGMVQDLTLDPEGRTTVVTFNTLPPGLTAANFESSGPQTATGIVIVGNSVQVMWDAFVSPSDMIRVTGVAGVPNTFNTVTTTDASAPTFTITDGTQVAGLGGDIIEVTFAGPHVDPVAAQDPSTWNLVVNSTSLDLTGSLFAFDAGTQVLTITTGPNGNLHANFTLAASGLASVGATAVASTPIAGVATGDAVAPTLTAVRQRLDLDEFGRTVEFEFSEAMDPNFSLALPNFGVTLPDTVSTVTSNATGELITVSFNAPMVPGVNTVNLTGMMDAHGNAFPNGPQAISAFNPVAATFDAMNLPSATTVENAGSDVIVVNTTQAMDPDSALDPLRWVLLYDGNPVDLTTQTLSYELTDRELTIELNFDMKNGLGFSISGSGVVEVDGEAFNLGFAGTVGGDVADVTVTMIRQNRTLFPNGMTLDVTLSEDVEQVPAETNGNWTLTGGPTVTNAELLLPAQNVVRLTLDSPGVPGDVTVTAANQEDLAGNVMPAPQMGIAVTSTDSTAPAPSTATANAIEGSLNDTLVVLFNDDMIEAEIETATNWTVESPVGTPFDTTGASVNYDTGSRMATIEFDSLLTTNFKNGDDFNVTFANARDIGGNTIDATLLTGNIVSETNLPSVHTIWRDAVTTDEVVIFFTEPCDELTDLYASTTNEDGTRYVLRDNLGVERAKAADAVVLQNGLGVRVGFSTPVAATDTIDVLGVTDFAGNPAFPAMTVATVAEDSSVPSLSAGFSTFAPVSGERNDTIAVVFDVPMSPWDILKRQNYTFSPGINLNQATLSFDGTSTVTITLDGDAADDLQEGATYDLTVNNVFSAQGVARMVADTELGIVASGDAVLPNVLAGTLRVDPQNADALLFESTEAVNLLSAVSFVNYDHDSGNIGQQAELLNPRTIRVTFGTGVDPQPGETTEFSFDDLAGNNTGVITRAVTAADAAAPNVVSVSGTAVEGVGGDYVTVVWDESLDLVTGLDINNYTFSHNGSTLDLSNAVVRYNSIDFSVTFALPAGINLEPAFPISSTIVNVQDVAGNALAGPITPAGTVGGDVTPPSIVAGFMNLREAPNATVVDVLFSEAVDSLFVDFPAAWGTDGAASVIDTTVISTNHVRLTLDVPLVAGESVDITAGLPDLANNTQSNGPDLTVTPEF